MYIETGAHQLVAYCAEVVRIMQGNEQRFIDMWTPVLEEINARLPSGSGFDVGSYLDVNASTQMRLVFVTAFHHMSDCGIYSGWTEHNVAVTPNFEGFTIRVTGRDKNMIKDYIADVFHEALSDYVKTAFDKETQAMKLVFAMYDYGFNGPIERKESANV
jgi:hypothetical protein